MHLHPYIFELSQRFELSRDFTRTQAWNNCKVFCWVQPIVCFCMASTYFWYLPSTFRPIVLAPPDSYFIDSSHSGCSFIPKQSMFEVWCIMLILHRLCTSITTCRSICHTLTHLIHKLLLKDCVTSLLFQVYLVISILFSFWWLNHIWVKHTYKPEFP